MYGEYRAGDRISLYNIIDAGHGRRHARYFGPDRCQRDIGHERISLSVGAGKDLHRNRGRAYPAGHRQ